MRSWRLHLNPQRVQRGSVDMNSETRLARESGDSGEREKEKEETEETEERGG